MPAALRPSPRRRRPRNRMHIPHSDAVSKDTGAPEGEALPWRSPGITGEFVTGKNDSEKEPVRLAGRIHPPGGPPDERHAARRTAAPQQEPSRQDIRIDGNIDDPAQEQGRGATRYYAQCRYPRYSVIASLSPVEYFATSASGSASAFFSPLLPWLSPTQPSPDFPVLRAAHSRGQRGPYPISRTRIP